MTTNSSVTIFHKIIDTTTKLEKWERTFYPNVWFFGGKGAKIDVGYDNANDVNVRIPYTENPDISKMAIGDIIVKGKVAFDIDAQQDLKGYETYNVTLIKNNTFGGTPHIHLGGK